MIRSIALMTAFLLGTPTAVDPAAHRAEVEAWRAQRAERLKQPANWLSLVGLHWIEPGRYLIGSGVSEADVKGGIAGVIRIERLPARFGVIESAGGKVTLQLEHGAGATIDGQAADGAELKPDSSGAPTRVARDGVEFILIERGGRHALRVWDAQSPVRTGFTGMDYFDIDPSWRIEARYEAYPPGKTIPIADVVGTLDDTPSPGAVVFERDGKSHRLEALEAGPGQIWFILADRTSGKSTYGAGRFLYADLPKDGANTVVVDFNKAYNPPCVFTPYATCPLAPPENRLDLEVTAGEKRYAHEVH
jgi:uncharacterized protein (DUF1684 family)